MFILFVLELNSYLATSYLTEITVDEGIDEMLKVNFDITIFDLPCRLASVDVSDITGMNKHNVTRNMIKIRTDSKLRELGVYEDEDVSEGARAA